MIFLTYIEAEELEFILLVTGTYLVIGYIYEQLG